MGARQKQWARTARIELMMALGCVCKECGTERKLEFDCIEPRGDAHHRQDSSARICFYRRQHREGNLQLLCHSCHNKKTKRDLETCPY